MIQTRRQLITGLISLIAAPAIVRATSLMPVKSWIDDGIALRSMSHPINTAGADFMVLTLKGFDAFGEDVLETIELSREALEDGKPTFGKHLQFIGRISAEKTI